MEKRTKPDNGCDNPHCFCEPVCLCAPDCKCTEEKPCECGQSK